MCAYGQLNSKPILVGLGRLGGRLLPGAEGDGRPCLVVMVAAILRKKKLKLCVIKPPGIYLGSVARQTGFMVSPLMRRRFQRDGSW